jgi:hypothetical protein
MTDMMMRWHEKMTLMTSRVRRGQLFQRCFSVNFIPTRNMTSKGHGMSRETASSHQEKGRSLDGADVMKLIIMRRFVESREEKYSKEINT